MYNISDKTSLWIGGQYMRGLTIEGENYRPLDKIIGEGNNKFGEYRSLLNGGVRYTVLTSNMGLSLRF